MDWIDKKAEKLIERFYPVFKDSPLPKEAWRKEAIQCAIICVDEIMKVRFMDKEVEEYWQQVKERLLAKQ